MESNRARRNQEFFFIIRISNIDYIPNEVWIPARVSKVVRPNCLDHVLFMAGAVMTARDWGVRIPLSITCEPTGLCQLTSHAVVANVACLLARKPQMVVVSALLVLNAPA